MSPFLACSAGFAAAQSIIVIFAGLLTASNGHFTGLHAPRHGLLPDVEENSAAYFINDRQKEHRDG